MTGRRCKWCGRRANGQESTVAAVACQLHVEVERAWRALRP